MFLKMNYENTYLNESNRLALLRDYVLHEAKKYRIFQNGSADEVENNTSMKHRVIFEKFCLTAKRGRDEAAVFIDKLSIEDRWHLFHAISCGVFRKDLFNCVGWPELQWDLENYAGTDLICETRVGFTRHFGSGCVTGSNLIEIAKRQTRQTLIDDNAKYDADGFNFRLEDPLIGRHTQAGVLIHDGNGRLLRWACAVALGDGDRRQTFRVWVGSPRSASAAEKVLYQKIERSLFIRGTDS